MLHDNSTWRRAFRIAPSPSLAVVVLLPVALALSVFVSNVLAERSAFVTGRVTDRFDTPLPGVTVRLTGTPFTTRTNEDGGFRIDQVTPGAYVLHVVGADFLPWSERVQLPLDDAGGLEIALVPRVAPEALWKESFSGRDRFGEDGIRYVPVRLRSPEIGGSVGLRVGLESDGSAERDDPYDAGDESFVRGSVEAGGRTPDSRLQGSVQSSRTSADIVPREDGLLGPSALRFFPTWTDEADVRRIRGRGQLVGLPRTLLTVDVDYAKAEGRAFANMWSRPGYVQTFFDTTQSGSVVLRHGHYSETPLDETYVAFDPRAHLPTETEEELSLRATFDQELSETVRYTGYLSYDRASLDSRVGGKEPSEYEGDRLGDLWFDYTDRESGEYWVIAGDFPRFAEGEDSRSAAGLDVSVGTPAGEFALGGEAAYRDFRVFEVLHPYWTNAEGEIGAIRTRHHEYSPSFRGFARQTFRVGELELGLGVTYESFHLLEAFPVPDDRDELEHEFLPRIEVSYPLSEQTEFAFLRSTSIRRPSATYPRGMTDVMRGEYRAASDLTPESVVLLRASLRSRLQDDMHLDVSAYYEDGSNGYGIDYRTPPGQVSDAPYLVNLDAVEERGIEIELARTFREGLGGTLRYAWGQQELVWGRPHRLTYEAEGSAPGPDDVRHRFDLSVDVGTPGGLFGTTRFRYESGRPYTPNFLAWFVDESYNSERLPGRVMLDIDFEQPLELFGRTASIFLRGRNVLDAVNIVDLDPLNWPTPPEPFENEYLIYYTETGRTGGAYLTGQTPEEGSGEWVPVHDPRVTGAPRSIRVGISLSL
ncbi:MAG: TonB-dependent receptor [Candidatus Eisenbacteria bacterium]